MEGDGWYILLSSRTLWIDWVRQCKG